MGLLSNKKTELTRVEGFALSIAQWSVIELMSSDLTRKVGSNVFFTDVSISTVSRDSLKNRFSTLAGKEYKAIKVRSHFTTLVESSFYDASFTERPLIEAEMLFQNIGVEGAGGVSIVWEISAMKVEVLNHPKIGEDCVHYDSLKPKISEGRRYDRMLTEREKNFKVFFKNLFFCSMGDAKYVVSFRGNIVNNIPNNEQ